MTDARQVIPVFMVLPPRTLVLDVAGPMEVLRLANREQDHLRFDIRYVSPTPRVASSIGLDLTGLEPLPQTLPTEALVVISGSTTEPLRAGDKDAVADARNEALICDWLARTVTPTVQLVSICAGALLAARAGLLDGHECTTHFSYVELMRSLAPKARVLENRLFVESGQRLSSAGVTAGVDLMLHLVARKTSPACAVAIARQLVVYLRRGGADPQLSPWLEGRNHIHPAVHRAQDAVVADPRRAWTLEDLADIAAASPRHLSRLFNEHASMSITDYVNRARITLAGDIMAGSRLDMESVAERAGFSSARQFRRAWRRLHDTPPSRMREAGNAM
ncbi:transcriptional regulator [Labrys miyagiensis]|uniref:Transcriptional regulator n=1 Tax=Labrys miyagiensis TaxID=346912 RepID=A0ABQ6CVR5_9HYPH|nr:helix-turn-helix domain-containing protein [Labrys miyagiensis]GLS23080.1 transcriptional regulator [Labrys miyagiensis]